MKILTTPAVREAKLEPSCRTERRKIYGRRRRRRRRKIKK
jgi:hypothetical protein